ncbi:uncharacterized protein N7483_013058 [Penicillium malachiteum]|uniref:uncharacterized protein n=1 Tax=Penicillium malachiteum TaxID=1324776 RepID=UPI002546DD6C|nr:uncharacterized protein N7483_013058 [Penicillium malachiteum]KAJ5715877.1 hypothetical protein N7483_013058 [Penicillium malachiteum]
MRFSTFYTVVLVFARHVCGLPTEKDKVSGLDIALSQAENTHVKAVVKNIGQEDKVSVYQNNTELAFSGISRHFRLQGITPDAFTTLKAGEAIEDEFDIAKTTDLSSGGSVLLNSSGLVPLVSNGAVSGYLPYHSNDLNIKIDGVKASQMDKAIKRLQRRTKVTCDDQQMKDELTEALRQTSSLASVAANAARFGSADKFREYFKTTEVSVRQKVAARLEAVAREADSVTSGSTTYYCTDEYGYCETSVLAYTIPIQNVIVNCELYYSYLPELASNCHEQDRATTSLHEFTHAPGVYSPGTQDLGYGYEASTALSSQEAVMNADTYALYANAIHVGC